MSRTFLVIVYVMSMYAGHAQTVQPVRTDSAKGTSAPANYDKVFSKPALTRAGLFTVQSQDNKWFFEIPDSLLNRYLLVVTRYKAVPAGFGNFGGEEVNQQTIYFEKAGGNKLFLRAVAYTQEARDSSQALYKAVVNSNVDPIVAVFDIKTINPRTGSSVIDVTDFFRKESPIVSLPAKEKTEKKLSSLADDRSYITDMRTYPINVEVGTVKTYQSANMGAAAATLTGSVTLELNTSIVLLPKTPMRRRLFDERVGFFANRYVLFDEQDQVAKRQYLVQRYRLEPKPQDIERYKRGERVEPVKPIIYYIDPATPKKWRPYLIAGVNDWQKAFEQAGFKNAIMAKEWPEGDSTMSLEDARFSVIRYYASETPNAYGPRISDPRSGEIIESHVGWFHNVMKLVHDWYMIQAGPLDARARKMNFDDELMGDLIRFVSSHEIGHTIGLRHNMGASSQTPVEKLRDKKWVEANGHTVSIMDYARFNYVAQPEDNIGKEGIYPRIGDYDKWAIEWGYRQFFGYADEYAEQVMLNKLTTDKLTTNPRLWFGGEGKDEDPRSQKEDIGDDAVAANDYGMKNLQRVVAQLPAWTYEPGDTYNNLQTMHEAAVRQYKRYVAHVAKSINSRYITSRAVEEKGAVYQPISKATVKRSVGFINRHVFHPPLWLYPEYSRNKLGLKPVNEFVEQQNYYLMIFLNVTFLYNLQQLGLDDKEAYKVPDFLNDLQQMVWTAIPANETEAFCKRTLQRSYIEKLAQLITPKEGVLQPSAQKSDVPLYGLMHARQLRVYVLQQLALSPSAMNRAHYEDIKRSLEKMINKNTAIK